MAHFEDHAFAGSEIGDGAVDAGAEFASEKAALRIVVGALFGDGFEEVVFPAGGFGDGRFLFADFTLTEVVEADVGDDAVEPGGKAAVEAEGVQVAVDAEEGFLVDVFGLFGGPEKVHGNAQDVLVVRLDERGEGVLIALLRGTDKGRFVHE